MTSLLFEQISAIVSILDFHSHIISTPSTPQKDPTARQEKTIIHTSTLPFPEPRRPAAYTGLVLFALTLQTPTLCRITIQTRHWNWFGHTKRGRSCRFFFFLPGCRPRNLNRPRPLCDSRYVFLECARIVPKRGDSGDVFGFRKCEHWMGRIGGGRAAKCSDLGAWWFIELILWGYSVKHLTNVRAFV